MTVSSDASPTTLSLPLVELDAFLRDPASKEALQECKKTTLALRQYGALLVRDPRVTQQHNESFLDLLERYFGRPTEQKMRDARPEYAFQVGVTPELQETPRCTFDPKCQSWIDTMPAKERPIVPTGPDPKWRYFWRIGERPEVTEFQELNAEPVVPEQLPEWESVMNEWGQLLLRAVTSVAEMAAIGFDLPRSSFSALMQSGPHLLAPTASDLNKYHQQDTVFAGFHYDLNFLTIHGKSRFPGLSIWTRDGVKMDVQVPDGCLLVQAGKQMEYLTGGAVQAGYHQVVVTPRTLEAVQRAKQQQRSLWRISSTLFSHIASDQVLQPLPGSAFATEESLKLYPPVQTGRQVEMELEALQLKQ